MIHEHITRFKEISQKILNASEASFSWQVKGEFTFFLLQMYMQKIYSFELYKYCVCLSLCAHEILKSIEIVRRKQYYY